MSRNELILHYAKKGKKKADIARMFNLSRERVRQIIKKDSTVEDPLTLY